VSKALKNLLTVLAPSAVLRVTLGKGKDQDKIDEIFMSKGEDLSGVR
jgi:hypothetical protein